MNSFYYPYVGLGLLLVLGACNSQNRDEAKALFDTDVIPVQVQPLTPMDTASIVMASGTFTTDDETVLSFKNGGIIQRITVKEGEVFKRGQLLAALEPTEIDASVRQSQLALEKAERDYRRAKQLYLDSVATLEQLENAQTAHEVAKAEAERATYNLKHTAIHAAFNGYVLQRPAQPGQVAGPGTPVLVVSSRGDGGWLLKVGASDRQWSAIQVGDKAKITSDVSPDQPIPAKVLRKSEGVDPQSGTFSIYLKVDGTPPVALAAGVFGRAEIHLSSRKGVWLIPYGALLDGDGGKGYVFVTDDGQTARRTVVQLGEIQHDHVVVTGGLEDAKSLIISGSPYLRDGSKITVKK